MHQITRIGFGFTLALIVFSITNIASAQTGSGFGSTTFSIENSKVGLDFEQNGVKEIRLISIRNKQTGHTFTVDSGSFWRVQVRDLQNNFAILAKTQDDIACANATHSLTGASTQTLTITWSNCLFAPSNTFSITLTLTLGPNDDFTRWRTSIANLMPHYGLHSIEYEIGIQQSSTNDVGIMSPTWIIQDPAGTLKQATDLGYLIGYGDGDFDSDFNLGLPFGFYTASGQGVYLQHRLPQPPPNTGGSWKGDGSHYRHAFRYFVPNDDTALNQFSTNWDTVLGVFTGDWYDLAQIHRAWLTTQPILATRLTNRSDIATYWKEMDLAEYRLLPSSNPTVESQNFEDVQDYYGADNMHLYYWNTPHIVGDFDFSASIKQLAQTLKANGVRASTYTHARSVHSVSTAASTLTSSGHACLDPNGNTKIHGPYLDIDFADPFWPQWYGDTVAEKFTGAGFVGAYLDNPFSHPDQFCYGNLTHTDGAGTHNASGLIETIRHVRNAGKAINPEFSVFYEGGQEAYLPVSDSTGGSTPLRRFELISPSQNVRSVPMLEALYHDFIPLIGVNAFYSQDAVNDYDLLDAAAAGHVAWGQIPNSSEGLLTTYGVPNYKIDQVVIPGAATLQQTLVKHTEFLKHLIEVRKLGRKYLVYGQMLRPLLVPEQTLIADTGLVGTTLLKIPVSHQVPTVWATAWRAQDGTNAIVLANYNATPKTVSVPVTFATYGLTTSTSYGLYEKSSGGSTLLGTTHSSNFTETVTVPAKHAMLIEILQASSVPPATPVNLTALAPEPNRITLGWTDTSDAESGFRIERSASGPLTGFALIATLSANSVAFNDTSVAAGTTYWYRIIAFNAAGSSLPSNIAQATTPPAASDDDDEAPPSLTSLTPLSGPVGTPIILSGSGFTTTENVITFSHKDGIGGGLGNLPHVTSPTGSSLAISFPTFLHLCTTIPTSLCPPPPPGGIDPPIGTYNVSVTNLHGTSNTVTFSLTLTPPIPADTPTPPTNLTATVLPSTKVKLAWKDNAVNETLYEIQRSSDGMTFATAIWLPKDYSSYEIPVSAGAILYYRVRAWNVSIASGFSNIASVTNPTAPDPDVPPTGFVSCTFSKSLTIGSIGSDVLCLQQYLNAAGFTIAASGSGSPGNETTYFGSLTQKAAAQWQNFYAAQVLAPLGLTSGTGYWGQASITHYNTLKAQAGGGTLPPPSSGSEPFTQSLGLGSSGSQVSTLQQFLAKNPQIYPSGLVTGYFGSLTEAAVKRFQCTHGIVCSGSTSLTGYGFVGVKTKAKLNELFTLGLTP